MAILGRRREARRWRPVNVRPVDTRPAEAARSLLRAVVPARVGVGEHWAGEPVHPPSDAELDLVRESGPRRMASFSRGRQAAREAMQDLGAPAQQVLAGALREPSWPGGLIGSLTHCRHYAAALVAYPADLPVLGVDAEPDQPLRPGGLDLVTSAAEQLHAVPLREGVGDGVHIDRLVFSAKESVYKAWFPLTRRRIEFRDVELRLCSASRTFRAWPLVDSRTLAGDAVHSFAGSWNRGAGMLVTAVFDARFVHARDRQDRTAAERSHAMSQPPADQLTHRRRGGGPSATLTVARSART